MPWQFAVGIWRGYLQWDFFAAICHGFLRWRFAAAICRGFLPWEFAVRICRSCMSWEFAVGLFCVCNQNFFLCEQTFFKCEQNFFLFMRISLLTVFLLVIAVKVMGHRTAKRNEIVLEIDNRKKNQKLLLRNQHWYKSVLNTLRALVV